MGLLQSRRNSVGPRGYKGPGGGAWTLMPTPPSFRGTSVQTCGFFPFAGGSSRPTVGVPVGQDIETGSTVCCDVFSWFNAGFISSPSMSLYGLNGMGKSSFAVRQILGAADRNIASIIPADLKGEYSPITLAVGGQVTKYGAGQKLNMLDLGAMAAAADRIGGERGETLREMATQRAVDMVTTQGQIVRRERMEDWETGLIGHAIRVLDRAYRDGRLRLPPTLPDLVHLAQNPVDSMIRTVLADDLEDYLTLTKKLNRTLQAILEGPLGSTFAGQTTERLRIDAPAVSVDISQVAKQSADVLAAVMLASWSEAFATLETANALADAGLEPQRHFLTIMDEMWRPMRLEGAGLVDKLDSITRLNRNDGVGNIFITHSLKDMASMTSQADNVKARGFAERSGIVVTAGLAKEDLRALSEIKRMSELEINTVASWSTPPGWRPRMVRDPLTGATRPAPPPGAGKVLIKLGERAGIQAQVKLTPTELALHDTNERWITEARLSAVTDDAVPVPRPSEVDLRSVPTQQTQD